MALLRAYTDPAAYKRAATGLETDSLVGLLTRLSGSVSAGATVLPVLVLLTAFSEGDRITLFDGPNSEVVMVTGTTPIGAIQIPVTPLSADHVQGTQLCSDGGAGSLSDLLIEASAWLETITQQPRWLASFSEILEAPSMRAAVDSQRKLYLRPRRFPVVAITELSYQCPSGEAAQETPLDLTSIVIDRELQTISLPSPIARYNSVPFRLTYTAGYIPGALPMQIQRACNYLVSALLADRQNPTGAASVSLGKKSLTMIWQEEQGGKSILIKRAEDLLRGEIERVF